MTDSNEITKADEKLQAAKVLEGRIILLKERLTDFANNSVIVDGAGRIWMMENPNTNLELSKIGEPCYPILGKKFRQDILRSIDDSIEDAREDLRMFEL